MPKTAKKILAVYFTQTGQLRTLVEAVCTPLVAAGIEVTTLEIKPESAFPFPWTFDQFFSVMPESVLGIPCAIEPLNIPADDNFDLILLGYQPWYLSPSLPVHAFLQNDLARRLLAKTPVITLSGSRNMWVSAHADLCQQIEALGGRTIGNISLCDPAPNMVSAITIVRWMLKGKRDRWGILPPAGISASDINRASRFAPLISDALFTDSFEHLRRALIAAGAVEVIPQLALLEMRVKPIFRLWARFIRSRNGATSSGRTIRMRCFQTYLLIMLYLVSPVISLLFMLIRPFRKDAISRQVARIQSR